jgi:RNA polymerase sigma-70 factor (ECF subfamily)
MEGESNIWSSLRDLMTSNNVKADEKQLIQDTLSGRVGAFGILVRKHQNALLVAVTRILGNRDEADDVVQQVFIDAYRHLADFRHGSQLFTWLYSIALNRARNHLRQRKARRQISLDGLAPGPDKRNVFQLPDSNVLPDDSVERQMYLEWISRQMQNLSSDYRAIAVLYYFHNLSLDEVARRVGRPLSTVKVYLHRARKELLAAHEELNV